MPNSISIEMAIEKNLIASTNPLLIALEVDVVDPISYQFVETLYLVRNSEHITHMGNIYGPVDFDLRVSHAAGELPSVSITVQDHSLAIQQKMQEYGGGAGFRVRMKVLNGGNLNAPPELVENYIITKGSAQNYVVTWNIGTNDPGQLRVPSRKQRHICGWRYKDPDTCAYSGAMTSCDLTLQGDNGCAAHGNEGNFGGFIGINSRSS